MELPGETFLFNLSLLAITFSAVSVLVTLLRQTMGGELSKFDVYLVNAFVQQGFALAIAAILPPLIARFEVSMQGLKITQPQPQQLADKKPHLK